MNRIEDCFAKLKAENRKALIGYLTAGDPTPRRSEAHLRTALRHGVDILEVGVPFSDPTADGPVIQAAAGRALAAGTNLNVILAMIRRLRRDFPRPPVILFSYANPLLAYGYEKLCRDARAAGVDGLLVVDLPLEESEELRRWMRPQGLAFIPLIAPTTPPARMRRILEHCREGFVYYILVRGVTGGRTGVTAEAVRHFRELRKCTSLPLAAGFGVRDAAQARRAARHADAVVVGSALVEAARQGGLSRLVGALSAAL
ncbi:MAG: tryptophan synthase subunit alpha [Lentisphaerae bacterium]|nr:tryptophan synthase subunit alpha [Lentisphaerota bacterium]